MVGIYKITSPSNRVYIGQSWDLNKRFKSYKNGHTIRQPKLHRSFNKYGFWSHIIEIVYELPKDVAQQTMDNYEILYINQYRHCGIELLNIMEGGKNAKHSEETKKKIGLKNKGRYIGIKRPPVTDEHRKNLSIALTGKKKSLEHTEKNRIANTGKKVSDRTKLVAKARWAGSNNPNAVKVICTETRTIFNTIKEAAEYLKINRGTFGDYLYGRIKTNKTSFKLL